MCGRFVVKSSREVLRDMFGEYEVIEQYEPNFNIAPSGKAPVYVQNKEKKQRRNLQWGLVPFFFKDPKSGFRMINSRAETIHEKPSFRKPFRRQRCAVAADGFYEWRKMGKNKVPYYISLQSDEPMVFAALYDHWKKTEGSYLSTFSIVTVEANSLMAQIHNDKKRMPAIIHSGSDLDTWMDNSIEDTEKLLPLLNPLPSGQLKAHMVAKEVGSPAHNYRELTAPVDDVYISKMYGKVPELVYQCSSPLRS